LDQFVNRYAQQINSNVKQQTVQNTRQSGSRWQTAEATLAGSGSRQTVFYLLVNTGNICPTRF